MSRLSDSLARRMKRAMGRRGEKGSVLLEFALTLPLLMFVLVGTAAFSVALYTLQQMVNATSSAVLYIGDDAVLVTDPCATAVTNTGGTGITQLLPNFTASKFTYTLSITYKNPNGSTTPLTATYGPTTGSSFTCPAGAAYLTQAENYPVTLTVSYSYSWLLTDNWSSKWLSLNLNPSSGLRATESALAQ
ncbi:MAG: TadE family protein [Terracidiphilus sp.]